jgi:hypothetical protein
VVQGATYNYKTTSTLGGSSYTRTVSDVAADGFTVTEAFANNKTLTKKWGCTSAGLVSLSPVTGDSASVNSDTTKTTIDTTTNTGVTLPTTITPGQTWTQTIEAKGKMTVNGVEVDQQTVTTQTFTAVAMESVTVPAGTFNAMRITVHANVHFTNTLMGQSRSSDVSSDSTLWYAPDVGEVKASGTAFSALTGSTELVSYKIQ